MEFMIFFFIAFVVVAVVIGILVSQAQSQQANKSWQWTAEQLGLKFKPGAFLQPRQITGRYRGQWVQVDTFQRGSGKSSKTYTRFEVAFPDSLDMGLRLSRQGFFSQVWTFLGGQDIRTGDAEFDEAIIVKGSNQDQVHRFLTIERRDRIFELLTQMPECSIDDYKIQSNVRGLERNGNHMVSVIQQMTEVARMLSSPTRDDKPLTAVLPVRKSSEQEAVQVVPVQPYYGELLSVQPVHPVSQREEVGHVQSGAKPPPLPFGGAKELTEPPVETTADTGQSIEVDQPPSYAAPASDDDAAAETAEFEAAAEYPETPDAGAYSTNEKSSVTPDIESSTGPPPSPPAETPPDQPVEAPSADTMPSDLSVVSVCEDLFNSDHMTHKISDLFEEKYKGQTVRWQGKLDSAGAYFFDMVFGNKPGAKATLDIHEFVQNYGTNKVQAIVQLPAELEGDLRNKLGEQLTFSGKLVSCDAFMRKLFVAEGRME